MRTDAPPLIPDEALQAIIQGHGTPFYAYSKRKLRRTIEELRAALPREGVTLLFATMANDLPEFLSEVARCRVGGCVNSIRHLRMALACGMTPADVQFTSSGISLPDMQELRTLGITVNLDSLGQLEQWTGLGPGQKAGMRINTASLAPAVPVPDRLGIEAAQLPDALRTAHAHQGRIDGLHIYVGTNFSDPEAMLVPLRAFFRLAQEVPDLAYVNIGGGIGVDHAGSTEPFDLERFGRGVCELLDGLRAHHRREIRLIFEPGRRIAATSAVFGARVTDIKRLNGHRYIATDASIAVFPRPFHHPESPHRTQLAFRGAAGTLEPSFVVGRTTFSRDILAVTALPADTRVGDVLLFENAGAYCDSMRMRFLGQEAPPNVFVEH